MNIIEKFNKLIFEGEYLNGLRNGKGKEYCYVKSIEFEGEYFNDKKWNYKTYDKEKNIIYEIKNGKGYFKENDYYEGLLYEGEYLYGERNGKGKLIYYDNKTTKFVGEFLKGKKNGYGIEYNRHMKFDFVGQYLYNHKLKGKLYMNNILEYEGEFLFNKKWSGKGYDEKGEIIYELKNGAGTVKEYDTYNCVLLFEGEYLNGKKQGKGKEYHHNSGILKFEGEYINGFKNGRGREFNYFGKLTFDGEFLNDLKNGIGKEYNYGALIFEGNYSNDLKEGYGKEYNTEGKILFEGEYLKGKKWNGKFKEYNDNVLIEEGKYLNGEKINLN